MSLIIKEQTASKISPISPGTYQAVCYGVVDVGDQYNETFKKASRKVIILWELPGEFIDSDDGPQTRTISGTYTSSLSARANLRGMLEAWRGAEFSDEELKGFNLKNIVGVNCHLTIVHKEKNSGGVFASIAGVSKLMKELSPVLPTRTMIVYDMDVPSWEKDMQNLPEWIQKRIRDSETYKDRINGTNPAHSADAFTDVTMEDCPF